MQITAKAIVYSFYQWTRFGMVESSYTPAGHWDLQHKTLFINLHKMPKTHRTEHLSLLQIHTYIHTTHSCVLMNAPDLFCRNWDHLLLATPLLSSSLFLALIKLPAAPVTNTLLISRLLLAKTDFRLHTKLKKFLVRARDTRGAGAKSRHEVMDWDVLYFE